MYAFIEGQVCEKAGGVLVLLAGGVGYQLSCSMTTLQAAPPIGETMRCHTYLSVREDAMELFGFATKEEKSLIPVADLHQRRGREDGPGALGVDAPARPEPGHPAGDVAALTRAPGIGKKTAQRIALELKDKISQADVNAPDAPPRPTRP